MKQLRISEALSLPLDAITHKFAILGTSGSGKSYTAMKLAELMLDHGAQIVAVDPVGIWWSLRLAADGKSDGYKQVVVFGGEHGDLPLTPESGALVARMLAERGIPAVLDVSQFISSEQIRFLTAFGEQFFESKKTHKSAVHLFLEECQTVVPQEPQRDEGTMLNRWRRLIKFGRNYGVGVSMISQQPQAVDKKVLNEAPTLFAMRTVGGHQRKAILSWVKDVIEAESDLVSNLPKLATGVSHVWSPEWLKVSQDVKILPKITFDAGKTPEIGSHNVEPRPLTKIDVDQFKSTMAEMIEKAKADDPRELRKQITALQRELQGRTATNAPPVDPKVIREQIDAAVAASVRAAIEERDGLWEVCLRLWKDAIRQAVSEIAIERPTSKPPIVSLPQNYYTPRQAITRPVATRSVQVLDSTSNGKLRAGAERMLSALAQWYPSGMPEGRLRSHAGMKKSGTFSTYMSDLRRGGYIEQRGDDLFSTQAGIDYFGGNVPNAPSTKEEVLAVWRPKLREGARRMLEYLVQHPRSVLTKDELAEAAGMTNSGTFSTYLSDLRRAQLIVVAGNEVHANQETLFL